MSIEFNCHVCGKLLRTSDEKAGKAAKCPGCGERLTVPDPAGGAAPPDDEFDDFGGESDFPPMTSSSSGGERTRACPMCGEQISSRSKRCEFCGEIVGGGKSRRRKRTSGDSNMPTISLVSGIVAIVFTLCCGCISLPASITAIVTGIIAIKQVNDGLADGKGMAIAGIICGSVAILLFIAVLVLQIGLQMGDFQNLGN